MPLAPSPLMPDKSNALNPVSPVLADTQNRLAKLADDVKIMNDHRNHINARLDAFEQSQNNLTNKVESIADSVKDILSNQRKQAGIDRTHMKEEVNKVHKEMHKHLATIAKSSWGWQVKIEASNRAAHGSDSKAMSLNSTDDIPLDTEASLDQIATQESTDTDANNISIDDIPYKSSLAQFRVSPATELTPVNAGGHPGQKRPISDGTTSGSG